MPRLTFPSQQDKPTLLISHHRLEGRIVNLVKPLAVLQKRRRDDLKEEGKDQNSESEELSHKARKVPQIDSSPIGMKVNQNRNNLSGSDDEEEEDIEELDEANLSPSTFKKRPNADLDRNPNPSKKSKITNDEGKGKGKELELETPSRSRLQRKEEDDSSPMPLPLKRGEALDFSSPQSVRKNPSASSHKRQDMTKGYGQEEEDNEEEGGIRDEISLRPTSTSYDMICIITKKILFDKRPEPVVRLEGAEGIEMAKALGIKT